MIDSANAAIIGKIRVPTVVPPHKRCPRPRTFEIVRAMMVTLSGPRLAANTKEAAAKASKVEKSMEPPKIPISLGSSEYAISTDGKRDL
ncbi:hypothetical protein A6R70_25085 [Agrobacterium rubi]|nr:hypothetical protein [Agrobacterium rubi]